MVFEEGGKPERGNPGKMETLGTDLALMLDGQTNTLSFSRQRANLTFLTSQFIIWYTRVTVDEIIRRIVCALAHATVSTFAAIRSMHLSASTASASCGIRVREGINITPYNTERNCYSSKDTYQYRNHQEPNDEGSIRKHTNHHAARVVLEPKELLAQKATRESILSIYLRSINKCFPPLVC